MSRRRVLGCLEPRGRAGCEMSLRPIVLWTPRTTLTSDDACTSIVQYSLPLPPSTIRAPYQSSPEDTANETSGLSYVPPLSYFCIKTLVDYPDQIHELGPARLRYERPAGRDDFDILQALIPTYRPFDSANHRGFNLRVVDPRLWAVLVQIFENLPCLFRNYTLPLSDPHLPMLQTIPSTEHFSLITVLSLSRCRDLTDDTVQELRHLHTLSAFDASVTALSSWGEGDSSANNPSVRRGPWGIRVLYLKDCINIDDEVLHCLPRFPLLSVVDLRGTICKPWRQARSPFVASSSRELYHPSPLAGVLRKLASLTREARTLFSHPTPHVLNVDSLHHTASSVGMERFRRKYQSESVNLKYGPQIARGRMDVFLPYKAPRGELSDACYDPACHCSISWPAEEYEDPGMAIGDDGAEDGRPPGYSSDDSDTEIRGTAVWPTPSPHRIAFQQSMWSSGSRQNEWMNEVATRENTLYRNQRAVDRFYAEPPRRAQTKSASSLDSRTSRGTHSRPSSVRSLEATIPTDPLMLFRTPPPWSSLPSSPPVKPASRKEMPITSVFATPTAIRAHSPTRPFAASPSTSDGASLGKRKLADEVAPADQARKRMHALSSIQQMFNIVQKRQESTVQQPGTQGPGGPSTSAAGGRTVMSSNPFARKAPAQKGMLPLSATRPVVNRESLTSPLKRPVASSISPPQQRSDPVKVTHPTAAPPYSQSASDMHAGSSSTGTPGRTSGAKPPQPQSSADLEHDGGAGDSPRPAKKLKPIMRLAVPDWPTTMKPLSAHRLKPHPPLAREKTNRVANVKQAALQMSRDAAKAQPEASVKSDAKTTKAERRMSAPAGRMVPLSDSNVGGKVNKGKGSSGNPPSKSGKEDGVRRASGSGGKGFDWKGWSAS
ncbi:hypothetical protein C8Q80DRAFT_1170076 [Daedaleopsis nitida]|nr:hypothetical protein C8Q80DRAFT_1170076 [Daedaleopsis nitida]